MWPKHVSGNSWLMHFVLIGFTLMVILSVHTIFTLLSNFPVDQWIFLKVALLWTKVRWSQAWVQKPQCTWCITAHGSALSGSTAQSIESRAKNGYWILLCLDCDDPDAAGAHGKKQIFLLAWNAWGPAIEFSPPREGRQGLPRGPVAFPVTQWVESPPAIQETQEMQVRSLGGKDPLEEETATSSSILAWRIRMDRGTWLATVHRVTKSWTWLSN